MVEAMSRCACGRRMRASSQSCRRCQARQPRRVHSQRNFRRARQRSAGTMKAMALLRRLEGIMRTASANQPRETARMTGV